MAMGNMSLVDLGRYLESLGFDVGEHGAFGGTPSGGHTSGSMHYQDQALDVNWPGGGAEEARRLEQLFQSLKGTGADELIYKGRGYFGGAKGSNWGNYGHPTHLHIGSSRPISGFSGLSPGNQVPSQFQGSYDTDPLPLTAGQYQSKAESERAAQRQLQQAMLDLQRGRGDIEADWQHFRNTLGTATRRGIHDLREDMAGRSLAHQPAGMGKGLRGIRDRQQEKLAEGRSEAADRMRSLHRAHADAQMQAGETQGELAREESRWRSDLDRLLGIG